MLASLWCVTGWSRHTPSDSSVREWTRRRRGYRRRNIYSRPASSAISSQSYRCVSVIAVMLGFYPKDKAAYFVMLVMPSTSI